MESHAVLGVRTFEGEDPSVESMRKRKDSAQTGRKCHTGSPPKRMRLDVGHPDSEESQHKLDEESNNLHEFEHQKLDDQPGPPVQQNGRPLFLLDVFCGTAGVAAAFRSMGGDALGIDHMVDKRKVKGPVAKVNLEKESGQKTVLAWINEDKVDAVMLAPPCGTSSRAREIPLPKTATLRKGMQPLPLRSNASPNGLPHLQGVAKLKVEAANRLYKFTRDVINACIQKGIPFICENPKRSLMWLTDPFLDLDSTCRFQFVHACMYGSRRRKSTGLLMNFDAANLKSECDGQHQHLPWGMVEATDGKSKVFSTSLETEYPTQFCRQLSLAFMDQLNRQGKFLPDVSHKDDQVQKMGAGTQPRGNRSPLLLGEFKFKVDITSSGVPVPECISQDVHPPFQGLPLHAKPISSREIVSNGENGEKIKKQQSVFGIFRSPWDFFSRTLEIEHPLDSPQLVDKDNLRAMIFIRDHTAAEVATFRTKQLKRFMDRAIALSDDEKALKESLDPDVRSVLHGKRLLLFKEMALEAQVGDETLFDELVEGFSLTGDMPESKQFPTKLKPALISVQQLKESAVWAKKMIQSSCRRIALDEEVATAVYDETLQQLADGWVRGPFTEQQLDEKYNGCWVPSKRFGVKQGAKIRAVDDFSEFLINASVSSTERLQLFGIDEVINAARTFLGVDLLQVDPEFSCVWAVPPGRQGFRPLKGRALDLKAAYKQLARSPKDAWASILAVWSPRSKRVEFFESVALPFGSVCAVMAFNRMARALRIILSRLFMLVNTNFFDDFCQLETLPLCESAWRTAELVMQFQCRKVSRSEDKRLPFSYEFSMLGAIVDLTLSGAGRVMVRNKDSRMRDIGALVEQVCERTQVPASLVETLKGRLLYAAGHSFGRCTQLAVQLVSRLSRKGPLLLVDDEFRAVLRNAFRSLSNSKPREVSAWSGRPPLIVFTDGACEEDGTLTTHGATMYDPENGTALMFGDNVPDDWVTKWKCHGKRQLICQAEIFPILVCKATWAKYLSGRAILWFIDNNAALSAVIRSFSAVLENFELLMINANLDVRLQCLNWYSRVPSRSNLSDDPSRLCFGDLEAKGFVRCQPSYESLTIERSGEVA